VAVCLYTRWLRNGLRRSTLRSYCTGVGLSPEAIHCLKIV